MERLVQRQPNDPVSGGNASRHSAPPSTELTRHLLAFGIALAVELAISSLNRDGGFDTVTEMLSFNVYALVYLSLTSRLFNRATAGDVRHRADRTRSRPRRWMLRRFPIAMALFVGGYSVFAVVTASPWSGSAAGRAADDGYPLWMLVALSGLTVALAWTLAHVAFAHHYARLYYAESHAGSGMSFPGDEEPNYLDFAYLAFSIGMTFGPPDVDLTQRRIRQAVLGHQLFSFVFNTVIVAFLVTFLTSLG